MSVYCFNTSTIRNCGLTLQKKIEITAQAGYEAIELWVAEIETYLSDGGSLEALKAMVTQNQLKVVNLIAFPQWASPDAEQRQQALAEAVDIFETAQALDCPYVAAPPMGLTERTDIPLSDIAERRSN